MESAQQLAEESRTMSAYASNSTAEEKITWAHCPVCHKTGEEGGICSNCVDMGMIFNVPIKDYKPFNLENYNNLDTEVQDKSKRVEDIEAPNSENHEDLDDKELEVEEPQELGGSANQWNQVQ